MPPKLEKISILKIESHNLSLNMSINQKLCTPVEMFGPQVKKLFVRKADLEFSLCFLLLF